MYEKVWVGRESVYAFVRSFLRFLQHGFSLEKLLVPGSSERRYVSLPLAFLSSDFPAAFFVRPSVVSPVQYACSLSTTCFSSLCTFEEVLATVARRGSTM